MVNGGTTTRVVAGKGSSKLGWGLVVCLLLSLAACQVAAPPVSSLPGEPVMATSTPTAETAPAPTQTPTSVLVQSPTPAASATPGAVFYEPAGCWQPPDDYSLVQFQGFVLNARTVAMLQQAALLYDGEIDLTGDALLQGSFTDESMPGPDAHLGGGEVDISVNRPGSSLVLYTEIEPLTRALRTVGFAAWLRDEQAMGSGSRIYVHAIAIGDATLSPAAQAQLSGPAGYLRGKDGLPVSAGDPPEGDPGPDPHGGPLICRWMLQAGYADLREPTPAPVGGLAWQERLRQAALSYVADYPEDAERIARGLNFLDGQGESAENICGPLSAAILRDAGLLPTQPGPVHDLKSYWQARPSENGRPWSLFSARDYEVFHFDTPLHDFDFRAWPLLPADFVYTYASASGFEHMFIVTEVDAEGRAYTVTNQYQAWANKIWGKMLIQRYLLYDPNTPGAGIIYNEWSDRRLGQTGNQGFEVLRKRGLEAGSVYAYIVRPGDSLPELSLRFGATLESLVQANPELDLVHLQVGQPITIPIPTFTPKLPANGASRLP